MSNDGSYDNPWSTIQEVFGDGLIGTQVLGGDTVLLREGYHGQIFCSNVHNSDYITIAAQPGHTPKLCRIGLTNVSKWIFRGLTISPEFAPVHQVYLNGIVSASNSYDVIVENNNIFSVEDASDWTMGDWISDSSRGIAVEGQTGEADVIVTNNTIKNVEMGVRVFGDNALVENNHISYFAHDAITVSANNVAIEYNVIKNSIPLIGHPDGIQCHRGPDTTTPIENIVIRGNVIISKDIGETNPLVASPLSPQGIMAVACPCINWLVENNIIMVQHYHGISIYRAIDSKIINNVAFDSTISINPENGQLWPVWISMGEYSTNTIVRNNMSRKFTINGTDMTADHNLDIDDYGPDALFANYSNNDLMHKPGSPAIDAGSPLLAPSIDIDRSPRPQGDGYDIGCYEYIPDSNGPVLDSIGDKSVDENSLLIFDVNATDPDGDVISYSAQYLPSGASFAGQTFSWTPSYNQAGDYQVRFIASAGSSQDSETITITVNNVNRPPVIGAISDQSVDENNTLSFSVDATDPDGETLTYSVTGLPAGAVLAGQTFTWTPSYDQAGSYPVTFTASDGQAQDSQAITITVINVNRAPVLTAIGDKSAYADTLLNFMINAIDPDGDAVTYSAANMPSGATFATQTFDWTPGQSQAGSYDVTFTANDGQLQDSETVTMAVDIDSLAPTVTNCLPAADSIQAPLNTLITLHITDSETGINPDSVKIKFRVDNNPNSNTVYFGDTNLYTSPYGKCLRLGTKADYTFVYQAASEMFDYDQTLTITVNANDVVGNVMNEYSYSFATEMYSFGRNTPVNSGLDNSDRPVTVCDSSGNIWTAWYSGAIGNRDIYVSKLAAGADNFGSAVQITNNAADQCNPAIALDSNDKLYVVWQDNRLGDWDIYLSTSVDGISWSTETRVNDPNEGNQVNPAIAIDGQSPNHAHVVWQDDRAGNQDICIATSSDDFATKTVSQITSNSSDQIEPAVTADSANTISVVWTDERNGSSDIYGAASNDGPWTNVAIVSNANNQSNPAIAAESTGSILHILWVDDTSGDNDIYYASSNGLPNSSLAGSSIIDDTSGADQLAPSIVVMGTTGNDLKVFACWQDWRNTDTDLYFAELSSGSGTNIFVGDDGSNAYQGEPVIGIDEYDHPYLIWADNRNINPDIYYAGSTFLQPSAIASTQITAASGGIVGADPQAIATTDDVSIVVPAGACPYDVAMTITKIENPQIFALLQLCSYDFGPSGIQFNTPVTIIIPYAVVDASWSPSAYWYDSLTGVLSQQGITDIENIVISPTLHAVRFKTTHFTPFYLLGSAAIAGGGGGGGGCSLSAGSEGNIVEFLLPYIGLALVMVMIKMRDARNHKARSA